ncbi:Arv1 protein [Penicillium chermesinum]|uniref:Protein ARV n=1 Tax=Penicillium chermesinum TaxID=63820 RepID=A0A9W9TPQ9_9EURO|nr:Arv1 protein [Penicillium chermesinum]KAJ5232524.1 Arv1 protein [Penicillium chermesinum]
MPICIECSYPVSHLYSAYSRADDRSQGKGVRLTQCPRCQRFADKYIEYDFVVIFIDLVLIKPQVYRHLLFNRLGRDDNRFDRSIIRLGVLLLLFDVYLTWARLEKDPSLETAFISRAPIVVQYLFFLTLNTTATLAHHLTVRLLSTILVPKSHRYGAPGSTTTNTTPQPSGNGNGNSDASANPMPSATPTPAIKTPSPTPPNQQPTELTTAQAKLSPNPAASTQPTSPEPLPNASGALATTPTVPNPQRPPPPLRRASTAPIHIQPLPPPTAASPTAISTALLVSSCAKLFPILLVIWGTDSSGNQPAQESGTTHRGGSVLRTQLDGVEPTPVLSAKAALSSDRGSNARYSSSSLVESWVAGAEALLCPYIPMSYMSWLFELLAASLSLGVVDTHLVLLSNTEALYILLGCGYMRAVAVAVAGQVARWVVQKVILGAVGVG